MLEETERNVDWISLACVITRKINKKYPWLEKDEVFSISLLALTRARDCFNIHRNDNVCSHLVMKGFYFTLDMLRQDHYVPRKDQQTPYVELRTQNVSQFVDYLTGNELNLDFFPLKTPNKYRDFSYLLLGLPSLQHRITLLYYMDDMSYIEISRECGITPGKVACEMQKIRRKLRRELPRRIRCGELHHLGCWLKEKRT